MEILILIRYLLMRRAVIIICSGARRVLIVGILRLWLSRVRLI